MSFAFHVHLKLQNNLYLNFHNCIFCARHYVAIYICALSYLSFSTVLERFPTLVRVQVHTVVAGKPVKLQCEPPASYPTGNIYWGVHGNDGKLFPVDNTERITMDYDG